MSGRIWAVRAVAATVLLALVVVSPAAATVITDFSNGPTDAYGAWASGTITAGPDDLRVQSTGGFGGMWYPVANPVGANPLQTTIEFTLTAHAGNQAGPVIVLHDGDGTLWGYGWFGIPEGTQTLTVDLYNPLFSSGDGDIPGLDVSTIDGFHLQGDVGTQTPGITDITFDHLAITPEPASAALLGLGVLVMGRRRGR